MDVLKILSYPFNEMVLEGPFDDLVEKIRGEQFMDVRAWKMCCKRLKDSM
jgi:hypothetical protein